VVAFEGIILGGGGGGGGGGNSETFADPLASAPFLLRHAPALAGIMVHGG